MGIIYQKRYTDYEGGRNMYANFDKQLKRNNYLPYISKRTMRYK